MKETVSEHVEPPLLTLRHRCIQEDSSLYILPWELLEKIIHYLDSLSAIRLSLSCAKFYNLVNQTARWKSFVRDEMRDMRELLDLGLAFSVPLWRPNEQVNYCAPWRQIVHSRKIFKSIRDWEYKLAFDTSIPGDEITSVSIAGQAVVFGTHRGGLAVWNPDQFGSFHSILQTTAVIDQIFVQLSPGSRHGQFFYRVVVHSLDTNLVIYDFSGYTLVTGVSKMRAFNKISNHGDNLVEWDPIRGNNGDTVIGEKVVTRCVNQRTLPFGGPFVAIDFNQHLYVSQSRGPLLIKRGSSSQNKPTIEQLLDTTEYIANAYVWPGRICFCITSGRVTIISVGRKCKAIRWPPVFRCVSATLFANVLAVGTDIGQVLFYTFKTISELLTLNPLNYQKSLSVGSVVPIIYVGFRMPNHKHQLPDVVAATGHKLFCFRAIS